MTIGERIKRRREELGISVEDIAKKLGKHRATIYRYESNEISTLPTDVLIPLSVALDTTPAYLMGWGESPNTLAPSPIITEDVVTFPVIGDVAAGYDHIAIEDWEGDTVEIPASYLRGRSAKEYFVLRVIGDSMYPLYMDGDKVLVLRQETLDRSGDVGVLLYNSDQATLKKVEYVMGEDWLRMIPINPNYPPVRIEGPDLEQCRVLGIPRLLIREIENK